MNYKITIGENVYNIDVERIGFSEVLCKNPKAYNTYSKNDTNEDKSKSSNKHLYIEVLSPMDGKILRLNYKDGDKVSIGDTILILEAMKMENEIVANKSGTINYKVNNNENVITDQILATIN